MCSMLWLFFHYLPSTIVTNQMYIRRRAQNIHVIVGGKNEKHTHIHTCIYVNRKQHKKATSIETAQLLEESEEQNGTKATVLTAISLKSYRIAIDKPPFTAVSL